MHLLLEVYFFYFAEGIAVRRLFALVFFMILLFVFISCSEATPFKTEDAATTDLTETVNAPNTITKTEELTKEKETSTTEFIPPQTASSSTTKSRKRLRAVF